MARSRNRLLRIVSRARAAFANVAKHISYPYLLCAATVLVLVSRLPWLSNGYGRDPDAYRVVSVARTILNDGVYEASRLPGYPVHEYLVALTAGANGPVVPNGLTALFSCAAFVFLSLILRVHQIRHHLLMAFAFALTPVVYINSVVTMDYMIALALSLGGVYFGIVGRPIIAGVMVGLSIGSRITAAAILPPLVLWMMLEAGTFRPSRRIVQLCLTATAVAVVCFFPVIHRYGLAFLTYSDSVPYPTQQEFWRKVIVGVGGDVGVVSLLVLVSTLPFVLARRWPAVTQRDRNTLAMCFGMIVIYFALFIRLPHEAAYLIPAVPFVAVVVALVLPWRLSVALALLMLPSSFVSLGPNGRPYLAGPILVDYWARQASSREMTSILQAAQRLPMGSVLVAGWKLPQLMIERAENDKPVCVYGLSDAQYRDYVAAGGRIYFLEGMNDFNMQTTGFDIASAGGTRLDPE